MREYTSRRTAITTALAESIKQIDGTGDWLTNLNNNVVPRLKFWDEIDQFPAVHLNSGSESRDYQGGGYKDRFLAITIRCYVKSEDSEEALAKLLEDIETLLETNIALAYTDNQGNPQRVKQITLVSIDTDEGVLSPLGVGEMLIEVHY